MSEEAFEIPGRVAAWFADHAIPWYVAGGWAVDLFLGRRTRQHDDVDVAVYREEQQRLRAAFQGWTWRKVVGGTEVPWGEQERLELPIHEVHARGPDGQALEVLLQESSGADRAPASRP